MTFPFDFSCDTEFTKLLARRSDIDLPCVALELARDAYPDLDFSKTFEWLEARAEELSRPIARAQSELVALQELTQCLAETHGLHGDIKAYGRADSSYLQRVIQTKCGIPISLSVLYMAVARLLHIELKGVCAPMHFITRCDTTEGPLFLDAFSGGRILNHDECLEWLGNLTHSSEAQIRANLKPAEARSIVIRMLNNLKTLYSRHDSWDAAWRVQRRLAALQPDSYRERRDLGVIALRSKRPGQAFELLLSCLKTCPDDQKAVLQRNVDDARNQIARWN